MKTLALIFSALAIVSVLKEDVAAKNVRVKGHTTKNGTYVPPHDRSAPNRTKSDNYSTKGNSNPYTGKSGTKFEAQPVERRGCCSRHGGVCGCAGNSAKCCDGTLSPTCDCE